MYIVSFLSPPAPCHNVSLPLSHLICVTYTQFFSQEAIDNVLELWPELHEYERSRIHLFVGNPEHQVRVPKMAWQIVLCDLPRYDYVHVQVDQPPPPPQYQGDVKGNWESGDEKEKRARSGGFFSSIKRIFSR
jgi:hypothetical protein